MFKMFPERLVMSAGAPNLFILTIFLPAEPFSVTPDTAIRKFCLKSLLYSIVVSLFLIQAYWSTVISQPHSLTISSSLYNYILQTSKGTGAMQISQPNYLILRFFP